MKFLGLCGVLLAAGLAIGGTKAQEFAVKELIPTGKLRFGVALAPKMSALFVVKDAGGSPRGVTADLGNELAKCLGVPIEFMVAPNTGALTDALASAAIDVAFMPVDEERKKRLEFGPAYCLVESTYMVTAASGIRTLAEVDRAGRPCRGHCQYHDDTRRRPLADKYHPDRCDLDRRCGSDAARGAGGMPSHSGAIRYRHSSRNSPARTSSMELSAF